jgi:hypothetical protein
LYRYYSATTLDMLSEYHRPLLNHQAYAETHHYGWAVYTFNPQFTRNSKVPDLINP